MQTVSDLFKSKIKEASREFECKIIIGDNIYTNKDLVDIKISNGIPGDGFMIGATPSATLDLTLLNRGDTIYSTNQINIEIGLNIGSKFEYLLMGLFNIDEVEKTDYTVKFTAYDNMIKFETAYFSSLGNTPTLQQVVNELASKTGVQFTGSLPSYTVKKLEGFTCREVLGYVASLCGGNALITRDGKFTIVTPKEVGYTITPDNYIPPFNLEEVKYKVGKVSCQVGEEVLSKGSLGTDSMELQFENPWITATILTDIYNKLTGFNYLGYSLKWQGDISLDIGDIVSVTDIRGVVRKLPILNQELNYIGGLTSTISAKGETKNKNSFNSSGSMSNKVNRLVTEVAIVNKAFIDYANINDANIKNLQVETAKIHNLEVETANINNILAGNIGAGNVQTIHLTGKNVVIDNAVIKSAMIDSLDLSKLKAGDISTNKFRITSDNGGIEIVGATQQFKDKYNKVRIQMGQDTQGNFNFILRGADGTTTLIDHTGIKEKAIADDLIKSNMVAADAIGEKQINYSSLITGLNKDDNTSLIKASKVAIDLTGQSLEVAFSSLKSNVDNMDIGAVNIMPDSDLVDGKNWNVSHLGKKEHIDIPESLRPSPNNGKKVIKCTTATGQKYCYIYKTLGINSGLVVGETYTITFWVYVPSTNSEASIPQIALFASTSSGWVGIKGGKNLDKEEVGRWTKISTTFTPDKDFPTTNISFGLYQASKGDCAYIILSKLSRGNVVTDWSPTPTDQEIITQSLQTQINANIKGIETLVKDTTIKQGNSTVKLQDFYSSFIQAKGEISQKVTQSEVDSSINKLELGGVNLFVKKTATKNKYLNSSGVEVDETHWFYTDYINVEGIKNLIASGYVNLGSATSTCYYDSNKKFVKGINNKGQSLSKLITIDQGISYIRFSCDIRGFDTLKIEKGTKSTSWSPAPEDLESRFNSVEQKITATAITTTITEAINAGINSLTTMQFVLDRNGATIKNGALRILNNAGTEVLKGDVDGNLTMSGVYINRSASTGLKAVEINDTNIYLYDWDRADKKLGIICSTYATNTPTAKGLTVGHYEDCFLSLDYENGSNTYNSYISFDTFNIRGRTGLYRYYPINVHEKLAFADSTVFDAAARFHYGVSLYNGYDGTFPLGYFTTATNNATYLCSHEKLANPLYLGAYNNDAELLTGILKVQYGVPTSSVTVYGNLTCTGTKPRTVSTKNFGMRELYAYETATPMFSDRGRGIIDEKGKCYIYLDTIFKETVSDNAEYDVFLQKYGKGELDIAEMTKDYFLIEGTPNLKFAWIIDCIQKGYEDCRLAQSDVAEVPPYDFGKDSLVFEDDEDYGEIGYKYIENYEKELLANG